MALEALCAGVPVVCSDVVGAKDLVDEGCVFHVGDARDLAQKIVFTAKKDNELVTVSDDYPLEMSMQVKRLAKAYGLAGGVAHELSLALLTLIDTHCFHVLERVAA